MTKLTANNVKFSRNVGTATKEYLTGPATPTLVRTIDNPNVYNQNKANDWYGYSVAMTDNYYAVGAPNEDSVDYRWSGEVYVYDVSSNNLLYTLTPPEASFSLNYGKSLAITDTYLLVGLTIVPGTAGVVYVYDVTDGTLLRTINNPSGTNDAFADKGCLAIDGDNIVVGARYNDSTGTNDGQAYIFSASTGQLLHTLTNPDTYSSNPNDQFGYAVAISGNYVAIGAPWEPRNYGTYTGASGTVYVYNATTGGLIYRKEDPSNPTVSVNHKFGESIAMYGTTMVVGAPSHPDGSDTYAGRVYVMNVTSGAVTATIVNPNPGSATVSDYFGTYLDIHGSYIVIGVPQEDGSETSQGQAYIYNTSGGAVKIMSAETQPNIYFGSAVAISSTVTIVGGYGYNTGVGTPLDHTVLDSGYIKMYDQLGNYIRHQYSPSTLGSSTYDNFGAWLHVTGNKVISSAWGEGHSDGLESGVLYAHDYTTGELLYTIQNPNAYSTPYQDRFGTMRTFSATDSYIVAATFYEDSADGTYSGVLYIFDITDGTLLNTITNPNAYSTANNDFFGYAVETFGDYAVVGAIYEDDNDPTGVNSGKAYVYQLSTGALVHTLNNPNDYSTANNDYFGYAVAINNTHVAVGAPNEDDSSGNQSGRVYIFNLASGILERTIDNPNHFSTVTNDYFGRRLYLKDNMLLAGSYEDDNTGSIVAGVLYVFDVTTGSLLTTITNPNADGGSTNDYFSADGQYAINDTYFSVSATADNQVGIAYIFDKNTYELVYTIENPNSFGLPSDNFAFGKAFAPGYILLGANAESDTNGPQSGKVYVYTLP